MSEELTDWDKDAAWLLERFPGATEEQQDKFCWQVCKLANDINREDARRLAVSELTDGN